MQACTTLLFMWVLDCLLASPPDPTNVSSLCSQIQGHGRCHCLQQVKCHACVGGTSIREDKRILQGGVHMVAGTPGRVLDLLRRHALGADTIRMCVLDEADRTLSRNFTGQIQDIFQLLPPQLQVKIGSNSFFRQCPVAVNEQCLRRTSEC